MPAPSPEPRLAFEADPTQATQTPHPATSPDPNRHRPQRGGCRHPRRFASALAALWGIVLIAAALPAGSAGVGCEGEWANSPICRERQAAVDARAKAEALMASLSEVPTPPWDALEFEAADAAYQEGMAFYRDEYFGDAAIRFQVATERLLAIEQALQASAAEQLAAADAALRQEDFQTAAAAYQAVLGSLPRSPEGAAGLAAATEGVAAQKLLEQARQAIGAGDLDTAARRLGAMPPGVLSGSVGEARRELGAARQRQRLSRAMSRGFRHLDRGEWQQAEAAFAEALRADPASAAAKDALEDLRRRRTDAELSAHRAQLKGHIEAENWPESRALLERMATLDPHDGSVARELPRISHLAEVEERIDGHLREPQRLSAKGVREAATALIDTTADPQTYGERITRKRDELAQTLAVWTAPVALTIRSDNKTEVRIRPGRVLGKFRERRLEVFPGDYVLSGRRVGYREVALKVAVAPGDSALSFEVVCNERF